MLDNNSNKTLWIGIAVGVVAILGIFAITTFPQLMASGHQTVRQSVSKNMSAIDLDMDLKAENSQLLSMTASKDYITSGFISKVRSGLVPESNIHLPPYDNSVNNGLFLECYLNQSKLDYLTQTKSDYVEFQVDYNYKNAKVLTPAAAQAKNLDTASPAESGFCVGGRTDKYGWTSSRIIKPSGSGAGTMVVQVPSGKGVSLFELYFRIANMQFDSFNITDVRIMNATS